MRPNNLRRRLTVAATIGVAALICTLGVGVSVANAVPTDPAFETYPHFFNGNVSGIRNTGSDTTFYMMQKIADLYTSAGLYGCTLNTGAGQTLFNSGDPASSSSNQQDYCQANANITTTDTADNWDRTEITEGVDDVGSGAGQKQLCGVVNTPLTVDFSRSSVPVSTTAPPCTGLAEAGYAKDSVPAVDFQINPNSFGTPASGSVYAGVNGGVIGDVAQGWLPGDPAAGPYSGTALASISNNDNTGGVDSTAYRLWCATDSTRITDWGQLTNLGPNLVVPAVSLTAGSNTATVTAFTPVPKVTAGVWSQTNIPYTFPSSVAAGQAITDLDASGDLPAGTTVTSTSGDTLVLSKAANVTGTDNLSIATGTTQPVGSGGQIGLFVRIMGVNSSSGTEATWTYFAGSGVTSTTNNGCLNGAGNVNANAAVDPNSASATGDNLNAHISLENNASQVSDFAIGTGSAQGDWPGAVGDAAVEVATTLYFESNGVYTSDPYAGSATLNGTTFSASKIPLNGSTPTSLNVKNNIYPTSRVLFNVWNTNNVKASVGGFINWLCDSNTDFTKGKDNYTGINFDTELTTIIGSFGFIRLTDTQPAASSNPTTPPDNVINGGINTSCAGGTTGSGAGNGTPPVASVTNLNS
jgi:hypothetical protein